MQFCFIFNSKDQAILDMKPFTFILKVGKHLLKMPVFS